MKLVCSDLDRTLLPNGDQPESPHARAILWHLLITHELAIAYVSGRNLDLVLRAIEDYDLAVPVAIAADVGTSIYWRTKDTWQFDVSWQGLIGLDWNGCDSEHIQRLLESVTSLSSQSADRQSRYKCSFFYVHGMDEVQIEQEVQQRLTGDGIKASLLFSHDPLTDQGLLDVVPQSATKREAVAYMATQSKLHLNDVLFAGDSGNDVTALVADHPGVLVANADDATRAAVLKRKDEMANAAHIYFAGGNLEVAGHESLNGNYSSGIIEALLHYQPSLRACLNDLNWLRAALK